MPSPSDPALCPAIELMDVDVGHRRQPEMLTVREVRWTIRPGDFWAIGGLQGSGKTDLLCTAAALHQPARGQGRFFGREWGPSYAHEDLAERLRVVLVFGEGGRLFNHLTVRENVALPLEYHHLMDAGKRQARVEALLGAMEVQQWANRFPSTVNISWRQRVALARALALQPEVLLLDDPLAGLDPRHTRWWLSLLDELSAGHPLLDGRPLTLVVAASDLRPWRQHARQFAMLDDQRLVVVGDLAALDRHEETAVWHDLLAPRPFPN